MQGMGCSDPIPSEWGSCAVNPHPGTPDFSLLTTVQPETIDSLDSVST